MNKDFGLDHQLIAVNNIEKTRDYLKRVGFNMTAIGKHPWGTSTTLAMFEGCLIEIMGIYDESLIDEVPSGDFHFGRHIYENLQKQEGIALSALYSDDIFGNIEHAEKHDIKPSGTLEFSRQVTLPNGEIDHTKTTLATFPNVEFPRLSFFLCQQHRPELIYVDEWLKHDNEVFGIKAAHINPAKDSVLEISKLFSNLYKSVESNSTSTIFDTQNGLLHIHDEQDFENHINHLSKNQKSVLKKSDQAHIFGMDYWCKNLDILEDILNNNDVNYARQNDHISLLEIENIGNMIFRFYQK